MLDIDLKGERGFFASIINVAIYDALGYQKPRSKKKILESRIKKSRYQRIFKHKDPDFVPERDNEYLARDGRRFISVRNHFFCSICHFLDIDPKYLTEKIRKIIKEFDKTGDMKIRKSFVIK